jgi:transglutaminase-like putative cysteine protease
MNIPARYVTGYLGDIGVPPAPYPMDFSAWFEAYIGGHWHAFDARHNCRRIGRIPVARGRDAADVPITMTFGKSCLQFWSPGRLWQNPGPRRKGSENSFLGTIVLAQASVSK